MPTSPAEKLRAATEDLNRTIQSGWSKGRDEIKPLQVEANRLRQEAHQIDDNIAELEQQIGGNPILRPLISQQLKVLDPKREDLMAQVTQKITKALEKLKPLMTDLAEKINVLDEAKINLRPGQLTSERVRAAKMKDDALKFLKIFHTMDVSITDTYKKHEEFFLQRVGMLKVLDNIRDGKNQEYTLETYDRASAAYFSQHDGIYEKSDTYPSAEEANAPLKKAIRGVDTIRRGNLNGLVEQISAGKTKPEDLSAVVKELDFLAQYQGHLMATGESAQTHAEEKRHFESLAITYQAKALHSKAQQLVQQTKDVAAISYLEATTQHLNTALSNLKGCFGEYDANNISASIDKRKDIPKESQRVIYESLVQAYAAFSGQCHSFKRKATEGETHLFDEMIDDAKALENRLRKGLSSIGQTSEITPAAYAEVLQTYSLSNGRVRQSEFLSKDFAKEVTNQLKAEPTDDIAQEEATTELEEELEELEIADDAPDLVMEKASNALQRNIVNLEATLKKEENQLKQIKSRKITALEKNPEGISAYTGEQLEANCNEVAAQEKKIGELCRKLSARYEKLANKFEIDVEANQKKSKSYATKETARGENATKYERLGEEWALKRNIEDMVEAPTQSALGKIPDNAIIAIEIEKLPHTPPALNADRTPKFKNGEPLYSHTPEYLITFIGGAQAGGHLHFDLPTQDEHTVEELFEKHRESLSVGVFKRADQLRMGVTTTDHPLYHSPFTVDPVLQSLGGFNVQVQRGPF
ncbi:MAG: hypothetical protein V4568_15815 [Pseudomonadota bacterium]